LIDAHLGEESGYDLCRQVKSALPHVKVLLLTSKQRPYDAEQGSAAGADDYFDKPFDSQKLLDKVSALAAVLEAASAEPVAAPPEAPPLMAEPAAAPPELDAHELDAPVLDAPPELDAPGLDDGGHETLATEELDDLVLEEDSAQPEPIAPALEPASAEAAEATSPAFADLESKLEGLGLNAEQLAGVLSLSKAVVEQVVWEVVPQLAETMIKEEIKRLTND
jgi:hypothetical protein